MIVVGIDVGSVTSGVAVVDVAKIGRSRLLFGANLGWKEAALVAMQWQHVCLECPGDVHQGVYVRSPGAARSVARAIANSKRVAGQIEGALLGRVAIVTTDARTWRKALCGSAVASDDRVKRSLEMRCEMGRTNNHVRDAVGAALWLGMRLGTKGWAA